MSSNYTNPALQRIVAQYAQRFPEGTTAQLGTFLQRNYPDLVRNFNAENLINATRQSGAGSTARSILGRGGRMLGLAGLALMIPQLAQAAENNGVAGVAGEIVRNTPQGMITEGAANFYIPRINELLNQQELGNTYLNNYNQLQGLE